MTDCVDLGSGVDEFAAEPGAGEWVYGMFAGVHPTSLPTLGREENT